MRLVWQNYALFPHLNVRRNIEFGLTLGRYDRKAVDAKVEEVAALVDIRRSCRVARRNSAAARSSASLSPARSRRTPKILLLDEPLSALDAHLRARVQGELKRLQRRLGISFLYVTHNQNEAFSMADRVLVMNDGRVEQVGTPQEIYTRPRRASWPVRRHEQSDRRRRSPAASAAKSSSNAAAARCACRRRRRRRETLRSAGER